MLSGYKTYIVAAVGIIGSIASYLVGDASINDTAQATLTAILGMTLRSGINTAVKR